MIYLFNEYNKVDDLQIKKLIAYLPEKRKTRAMKYRFFKDRVSCVIAYLLFLYGYREQGYTDTPDFDIAENGKPYISLHPDLFFNISHCNDMAVCIFDNYPIGIDIQNTRKINTSVIKKVCSRAEQELINNSNNPEIEFCRIWTVKEAVTKLSGVGITIDLKRIDSANTDVFSKFIEPDIFLTVASNDALDTEINYITYDMLINRL